MPNTPAFWPKDVLQETQGIGSFSSDKVTGALQHLLLASDLPGLFEGEAIAFRCGKDTAVVVRYRSPFGDARGLLAPVITQGPHGAAFMLAPFGATFPLAGMNEHGLAIARFTPGWDAEAYATALGPDTAVQTRFFLLSYAQAGFEEAKRGETEGVGDALKQLTNPGDNIISRIATPGVLLAADATQAARYEWFAGGGDDDVSISHHSVEHEGLEAAADAPPLVALPAFLCDDLKKAGVTPPASKLLAEAKAFGAGEMTMGRLLRLVGPNTPAGEISVGFLPARGIVLLSDGKGGVSTINLPRATSVKWKK